MFKAGSAKDMTVRIAQISPLFEAVPPKLYGGTERIVSFLTEELVAMGHDVTLFASGDSTTSARLVSAWPCALRLDPTVRDMFAPHIMQLEMVARHASEFDVMHFHTDYQAMPLVSRQRTPFLTTLHGRLDLPELQQALRCFPEAPLVSISDSQRAPFAGANWVATVLHGLPERLLTPQPVRPSYLAFLGRICPEKRPDRAVAIARAAGMKLRLAAKVDRVDQAYFETTIRPLLDGDAAALIGEIDDAAKPRFLSGARALLMPIDWPEPFGLVMIEAMACGTPVIAYACGSVPEVIEDGLTGFIVRNEAQAVAAVHRLHLLDRARIRRRFEERFTARRMAEDYLTLYRRLAQAEPRPRLRVVG
jgi:glycosyltransferase involved in cell wall biosynthesis